MFRMNGSKQSKRSSGLIIALGLTALLTSCGTDQGSTPVLQADPSTGAVTVKGEKGDRGEAGPAGPQGEKGDKGDTGAAGTQGSSGKDGTNGSNGASAESIPAGVWKDPITGRQWFLALGKFNLSDAGTVCSPWKLPSPEALVLAIQHGLTKGLPLTTTITAPERAWTNKPDSFAGYQRTILIYDSGTYEVTPGEGGYLTTSLYRAYCLKDQT